MKKLLQCAIALFITFTLAGCGSSISQEAKDMYVGKWDTANFIADGVNAKDAGVEIPADAFVFDFQEDGKVVFTSSLSTGGEGTWAPTDTGLEIKDASGTITMEHKDGTLTFTVETYTVELKKQ